MPPLEMPVLRLPGLPQKAPARSSVKASDKIKEFFEKNKKVFIWIGVGIALRFARCWNQLVFDAHLYRFVGYRFLLSQRG